MPHACMIEAADVERRFAITSSEIVPGTWRTRTVRFTLEGVDGDLDEEADAETVRKALPPSESALTGDWLDAEAAAGFRPGIHARPYPSRRQVMIFRMVKVGVDLAGYIRAICAPRWRWIWLRATNSGYAGMMHYRMGSDSAPDRIAAMRGLLADDPDLAEVLSGREMRRNSRTGSLQRTLQVRKVATPIEQQRTYLLRHDCGLESVPDIDIYPQDSHILAWDLRRPGSCPLAVVLAEHCQCR